MKRAHTKKQLRSLTAFESAFPLEVPSASKDMRPNKPEGLWAQIGQGSSPWQNSGKEGELRLGLIALIHQLFRPREGAPDGDPPKMLQMGFEIGPPKRDPKWHQESNSAAQVLDTHALRHTRL